MGTDSYYNLVILERYSNVFLQCPKQTWMNFQRGSPALLPFRLNMLSDRDPPPGKELQSEMVGI